MANNQAGLPRYLVARLACAPGVVIGAASPICARSALRRRLRLALLDDTALPFSTGSSRAQCIKYEEVPVTAHYPGTTLRRNPFRTPPTTRICSLMIVPAPKRSAMSCRCLAPA
jgi:hypothetical protein